MDIKAPQGHTSVYFTEYLRKNFKKFHQLQTAKGFTSFNSYANHVFTEDFNTNYAKLLKQRFIAPPKRIDAYNDTPTVIKEKLNGFSDGELIDQHSTFKDVKNILMHEIKKRDIKV